MAFLAPSIVKDSAIIGGASANSNFEVDFGETILDVSSAGLRRSLIDFGDISAIPSGSIVVSGLLTLFVSNIFEAFAGETIQVAAISNSDWVENQVTHNSRRTGQLWVNPGGDYNPSGIVKSLAAPTATGSITYNITPVIQWIYKNRPTDCDLLIKCTTDVLAGFFRCHGSEGATPPVLHIHTALEQQTNRPLTDPRPSSPVLKMSKFVGQADTFFIEDFGFTDMLEPLAFDWSVYPTFPTAVQVSGLFSAPQTNRQTGSRVNSIAWDVEGLPRSAMQTNDGRTNLAYVDELTYNIRLVASGRAIYPGYQHWDYNTWGGPDNDGATLEVDQIRMMAGKSFNQTLDGLGPALYHPGSPATSEAAYLTYIGRHINNYLPVVNDCINLPWLVSFYSNLYFFSNDATVPLATSLIENSVRSAFGSGLHALVYWDETWFRWVLAQGHPTVKAEQQRVMNAMRVGAGMPRRTVDAVTVYPNTVASAATGNAIANLDNVKIYDGVSATGNISAANSSITIRSTNFNIGSVVPVGSTITSIYVNRKRRASATNSINETICQLWNGSTNIGDNVAVSGTFLTSAGNQDGLHPLISSQITGFTPTLSVLSSSSFGVDYRIRNIAGVAALAEIDAVSLTIEFETPTTGSANLSHKGRRSHPNMPSF